MMGVKRDDDGDEAVAVIGQRGARSAHAPSRHDQAVRLVRTQRLRLLLLFALALALAFVLALTITLAFFI